MYRDDSTFLQTRSSAFSAAIEPVAKAKELRFIRATRVGTEVATERNDNEQPEAVGRCRYADQLWVFRTEGGKTFSLLLRSIEDAKEFAKYMGIGFDNFHPVREDQPIMRRPPLKEKDA